VWPDDGPLGQAFDAPLVSAGCDVEIGPHRLALFAPAVFRESFGGGYREMPLEVLPPIVLEPKAQREFVAHRESSRVDLRVTARCMRRGGAKGTLTVGVPKSWAVEPAEAAVAFAREGESRSLRVEVGVPATAEPGPHELRYTMTCGSRRDDVVLRPVRQLAPGLPGPANEANCVAEALMAAPAAVSMHLVDARFADRQRYAYVPGMEEDVVRVLSGLGLDVTVLAEEELAFGDLDAFEAIVVGPHAYVLRPHVRRNAARLLEYAERGGTLIVQLQGYGYQEDGLAPYPFEYRQPHDRVTLPDAPVTVLDADHPILHVPNEIGGRDFEGWVHDRGLYFFGEWDHRYAAVLASSDPGEEPKAGGMLVAGHGRGTYVYAGYSFFRQVPAGVPGALRLFANLLGLPEARTRERVERIRGVPFFSLMDEAKLRRAARELSERRLGHDEYLCREGEPGGELYMVLDGELEVLQGAECDLIGRHGPGAVLGELAILADTPRSASLRASGAVRLLTMGGASFRALLHEDPGLMDQVLELVALRLLESEQRRLGSASD
jgi:hypothetical protein